MKTGVVDAFHLTVEGPTDIGGEWPIYCSRVHNLFTYSLCSVLLKVRFHLGLFALIVRSWMDPSLLTDNLKRNEKETARGTPLFIDYWSEQRQIAPYVNQKP